MTEKAPRLKWIWAPWRMAYLQKAGGPGCFFCDYVRRKRDDRRNHVLLRGKTCFALLNRYPYNAGHLMIAPLAHKGDLSHFTAAEREEFFGLTVKMQGALERALKPEGYNLGINLGRAAGAGVPGHLHLHMVPRWNADTNFMPVVGHTKVVSQALDDLHTRLQKALDKGR